VAQLPVADVGPLPAAAPVDVDVLPGQFISITVAFDSGIRQLIT